ncbi:MAG: aminotransferase class IV [Epsilonproteobacteria bacterium]|nr:aminotransferase class IV [Campylobacterota bacterium]
MPSDINDTPLLLETIKIEDGVIHNLPYHQERCTQSRQALYGVTDILELKTHINPPPKGLYRCRILYEKNIHTIEYIPYVPKIISSLKIITSEVEYAYKYANRNALNSLLTMEKEYDDVLIEKNGYLTDTSIANIAFYDGRQWVTPQDPLLKGTMRQKLIDEGFLQTKQIKIADIVAYTQVALMNAMLGFKILKNITITDNRGTHYDY